MVKLDLYPNWSPCFTFVQNISPHIQSFIDSKISFTMVRFKERLKRTAVIQDFTAPNRMVFSFACPYRFWLEESWTFSLQEQAANVTTVNMTIALLGWQKVKAYQQESHLLQAFCEAHLEALKTTLEALDKDDSDDFFIAD